MDMLCLVLVVALFQMLSGGFRAVAAGSPAEITCPSTRFELLSKRHRTRNEPANQGPTNLRRKRIQLL
jgi:hypothetical protein